MRPGIKAVVFDAYGTLFDVHSVVQIAEQLFPGYGAALSGLWRDKQIDYTRLRTMSGRYADFETVTGDALDYAADRLGLAFRGDGRQRLMAGYHQLSAFADAGPALETLKANGLPLAILSNGTPAMLHALVENAGFAGLFLHLLSADTVRRYKTASEVYALGPDALGMAAGEIAFVSSNGWDAAGASWYGYRTFWVNRGELPAERLGVAAEAQGPSLADLVAWLTR